MFTAWFWMLFHFVILFFYPWFGILYAEAADDKDSRETQEALVHLSRGVAANQN